MKPSGVRGPKSGVQRPKAGSRSKENSRSRIDKAGDLGPRTPDSRHQTLIVGYGNPLRSDDGFGWHASKVLAQALEGQNVELITCHQLTPELAETLSQCRRAMFIDADAEGKPGEVHRRSVRPQAPASSSFTHTCTPSGLLASAQQLYGKRPKAVVITVSAQSFEYGDALSLVVAAALPKVVDQVKHWLGAR